MSNERLINLPTTQRKVPAVEMARTARIIERHLFGALLGSLTAAILIRLLLIAGNVNLLVFVTLLVLGAWTGAFLSHLSQRSDDAMIAALRTRTPLLRAMTLKAMLWLLGIAAIIGVFTVLFASYNVLGRVAGTVLATAIAAGFLWPLSLMIDRPKTLASGLFGMTNVLLVYCLVTPLIWGLDRDGWKIFFTGVVVGLTALGCMLSLLMISFPKVRLAGRLGTAVYVLVLASFCIAVWHPTNPPNWDARLNWWEVGLSLAWYGGLSVACLAGWIPDWKWLDFSLKATTINLARTSRSIERFLFRALVGGLLAATLIRLLLLVVEVSPWVMALLLMLAIITASAWPYIGTLAGTFLSHHSQRMPFSAGIASKLPDWRWLGVLACASAWCVVMLYVWGESHRPFLLYTFFPSKDVDWYVQLVTLFTSIGIIVAHRSLTLFLPLSSGQIWLRAGTTVALGVTAIFLNLDLLLFPGAITILGRVSGAAGIVASCATLALMVLARLNRRSQRHGAGREKMTEATLFCPACGKKQTVALGGAECSRCGLFVHVTVEKRYDQ